METVEIKKDTLVRLVVKINSVAITGSNVNLDNVVIKKSIQYNFNTDLGNINELDNKILSIVTNYFVSTGNIDTVMKSTKTVCSLKYGEEVKDFLSKKVKINSTLFMTYKVLKLIKK